MLGGRILHGVPVVVVVEGNMGELLVLVVAVFYVAPIGLEVRMDNQILHLQVVVAAASPREVVGKAAKEVVDSPPQSIHVHNQSTLVVAAPATAAVSDLQTADLETVFQMEYAVDIAADANYLHHDPTAP